MNTMVQVTYGFLICLWSSCYGQPTEWKGKEWDFLVYAQLWPSTSCVLFKEKHCVPQAVGGWTIHGLWPSGPGSSYPSFCNKSMKFDYDKIKTLRPQLDINWPELDSESSPTKLWEHEWDKHGTCAYSLEALRGEMNYFSQALHLHTVYNHTKVLATAGIVPSDTKPYNVTQVFDALKTGYGTSPNVVCYYHEETKTYYLDQIYVCMDKDFKKQDCPEVPTLRKGESSSSYYQYCPRHAKGTVYYLSLNKAAQLATDRAVRKEVLYFEEEFLEVDRIGV